MLFLLGIGNGGGSGGSGGGGGDDGDGVEVKTDTLSPYCRVESKRTDMWVTLSMREARALGCSWIPQELGAVQNGTTMAVYTLCVCVPSAEQITLLRVPTELNGCVERRERLYQSFRPSFHQEVGRGVPVPCIVSRSVAYRSPRKPDLDCGRLRRGK